MNPFKIDGIVGGVDYMPRKESEELLKYHKAGRNVLIRGPRRTGKSSLVVNTFQKVKCQLIRVDFWGVKTEGRAVGKIARAFEAFLQEAADPERLQRGGSRAPVEKPGSEFERGRSIAAGPGVA